MDQFYRQRWTHLNAGSAASTFIKINNRNTGAVVFKRGGQCPGFAHIGTGLAGNALIGQAGFHDVRLQMPGLCVRCNGECTFVAGLYTVLAEGTFSQSKIYFRITPVAFNQNLFRARGKTVVALCALFYKQGFSNRPGRSQGGFDRAGFSAKKKGSSRWVHRTSAIGNQNSVV